MTTIRPSSAHRWMHCTGSLELQARYPVPYISTPQAQYGTSVHEVAQRLLTHQDVLPVHPDVYTEALGFVEYVHSVSTPHHQLMVETFLPLDFINPSLWGGTPDAVLFSEHDIHIIDLKTGATKVSSLDNPQLLLYACGIHHHHARSARTITLHIYQRNPRSGDNINTHTLSSDHLRTFRSNVVSILDFVDKGIFKYTLGDHCQYCPVQAKCPAYFHQASTQYFSLTRSQYNLENLSTDEVARIYTLLKSLEPLQAHLQDRLLHEDPATLEKHNLRVKTRTNPLKYADEEKALQALQLQNASLDEVAPRTLLSPAKLKKHSPALFDTVTPYLEAPTRTSYLSLDKTTGKITQ